MGLIPKISLTLQVYIYSYLYEADDSITKAQMHMHAPLVLGMATGTAWSFGLFVVSFAQENWPIEQCEYFVTHDCTGENI